MRWLLTRRDALLRTAGCAAASLLPAAGRAATLRKPVQGEEIDAALQAKVAAREIPGVVAMAADEGSIVYQGAFGPRNLATAVPMSTDTVFRIASMVKLLTSVAALQLVDREAEARRAGGQYRSGTCLVSLLTGFDARGVPQLRPAQKPITLRHLLSHTSGFSYPLWDPNVVSYNKAARSHPRLPRRPLMFEPGTRWAYGGSLDNVGRLVEIASGQSLDRYFSDHITGPLGMNDTAFTITEKQRARQAVPACAGRGWKAAGAAVRKADGADRLFRRRRHLFHRAGLSDPAAGAAQWRKFSWKHASCGRRALPSMAANQIGNLKSA